MSRAVKSDGLVDSLINQMAGSLPTYAKSKVDAVLVPEKLKQCRYVTLLRIAFEYVQAFDEPNWQVHAYILTVAERSATYRKFRESVPLSDDDPLVLLSEAEGDVPPEEVFMAGSQEVDHD